MITIPSLSPALLVSMKGILSYAHVVRFHQKEQFIDQMEHVISQLSLRAKSRPLRSALTILHVHSALCFALRALLRCFTMAVVFPNTISEPPGRI